MKSGLSPGAWILNSPASQSRENRLHTGTMMGTKLMPKSRAYRFAVELRICYRRVGKKSWFEGKTENVSRSGVLFRTQYPFQPETAIQMNLPLSVMGIGGGMVSCRGTVVRTVPATGKVLAGVAATIESYRLKRSQREN